MDDLWSALSFRKQSGELIIVAEKQMEPNLSEKYVMAWMLAENLTHAIILASHLTSNIFYFFFF